MQSLPPLILDLAIMLGIASIITLSFQRIGQPVVLGYLLTGVIVGPYTPPYILVSDIPNIKILSELGVIFLIFSLGLEFSFHKLVRVGFSASLTGFLEVVLMTILGFITGKMMGWSFNNALFLGAALSISSTTIIIKAIEELNLAKKRFAELIFGILIIEDLLAILLLVVLSAIVASHHFLSLNMVSETFKLILVIGGWFIVGYFFIPTLHRKIIPYASEETITIIAVGLCLLLVSLAAYLNYSIVLGAFIMGSVLAETNSIHRLRILIKPIRDIFAAIFFIATGMLMNPKVVLEHWPMILIITLITILGKLISIALSAFLTGQSLNTSIRVGFGMAQIGEFSFIIIGAGVAVQAVDESLYPIIVAVCTLTTFTTPYLILFSGYLADVLDKKLSPSSKTILENYSSLVLRILSVASQDHDYKRLLIRLILNGIIVAIVFTLSYQLLPWTQVVVAKSWLAKTICWFSALLLSSPFLWGMIFSSSGLSKACYKKKRNLMLFTFLVTNLEIILLSLVYFKTGLVLITLLTIMLVCFAFTYKNLEKIYLWFENHLTRNVNNRHKKSKKYAELAPWDNYLVEVRVGPEAHYIHQKLKDSCIRQRFRINIVAIQRDQDIIFAPTGRDILLPYDKLIILGEEGQIDQFRKNIEKRTSLDKEPFQLLDNIILKTLLITDDSELVGKNIRESKLREHIHGIVVGLERDGKRILNPDPDMHLIVNDLLFVAGDAKYLDSIEQWLN